MIAGAAVGLRDMKHSQQILDACVELGRLENLCDDLHAEAIVRMFREEPDAITVMKWREVYDRLEKAADSCEAIANVFESIVMEHNGFNTNLGFHCSRCRARL